MPEPVIELVDDVLPPTRRSSLLAFAKRVTSAQFIRYIIVGGWNTAFGYGTFALFTYFFTRRSVHGYIYAAVLSNLLSITVAFFGYKFFVFKTKGNYLKEWTRCMIVYGSAAIPGIFFLPIIKNALVFSTPVHAQFVLLGITFKLHTLAPYIAGAAVTACTVVYSFFGHRKFSFKAPRPQNS
ncbi:MAG TPA: GtrA family protein [Acidobacteriaceae bacterium]